MIKINNKDDAISYVYVMKQVSKYAKDIEKSLRKYVDENGNINIKSGIMWGKHEVPVERIELNAMGINVILEKVPTALKTNTSKVAIEAAVREAKLPIEQTTNKIMEDLKKVGSVIETKQVRYNEYNVEDYCRCH